jgi:site-specific DNA recombinase
MQEQQLGVIYARFSTDRQTDSIDSQVRRCQRIADLENIKVIGIFIDRAVSGTTVAREGHRGMMAAAKNGLPEGKPQVAIVSDIARLSRDLGAMFGIVFGDLPSYGVRTLDAQTGMYSDASGARTVYAAMGMAADSFAEQTRIKTRDGLQDRAKDGYWTGGSAYGFRTEPEPNPKDPENPYIFLRIDEEKAPLIREIFHRHASGETTRVIADDLNRRKIEAPRTNSKKYAGWGASTIRYILRNERYAGVMRYGTHRWFKHSYYW